MHFKLSKYEVRNIREQGSDILNGLKRQQDFSFLITIFKFPYCPAQVSHHIQTQSELNR